MNRSRISWICLLGAFLHLVFPGLVTTGHAQVEPYEGWWDGFAGTLPPGVDDPIYSMVLYDGRLILGGSFTTAGSQAARRVVGWDGAEWSSLGRGLEGLYFNLFVWAMTTFEGDLIAGGRFGIADGNPVNALARWDGVSWTEVGGGLVGSVYALAEWDGALYVGGDFTVDTPDGSAQDLARWDGVAWSSVGGGVDDRVNALTVHDGSLYVGGDFVTAGGVTVNRVARWDGSWHSMSGGVGGRVSALHVNDGWLIVGGLFADAGGATVNNIASWNGSGWSPLGAGTNSGVYALTSYEGALIVGGGFTQAGGLPASRIAAWNGIEWSPLGAGVSLPVDALQVYEDHLFVGGAFTRAGELDASYVATWNGSAWETVGPASEGIGLDDQAQAMMIHEGRLIVGGSFEVAGETNADLVAAFDGVGWSALGAGIPHEHLYDWVSVLCDFDGALYAGTSVIDQYGGEFGTIWRWDGSEWSVIGQADGFVLALIGFEGVLVAAGAFGEIDGVATGSIAAWDGDQWASLDSPMPFATLALGIHEGKLVAGGSGLWFFDGVAWTEDAGTVEIVNCLLSSADGLYVGGRFDDVSGIPALNIALWNGSVWTALGEGLSGVPGSTQDLALYGDQVVAVGTFGYAGGSLSPFVALWNGHDWLSLGSGLTLHAKAAATYEGNLYVTGLFHTAGESSSFHIGRWVVAPTDVDDGSVTEAAVDLLVANPYRPGMPVVLLSRDPVIRRTLTVHDVTGRQIDALSLVRDGAGRFTTHWSGLMHGRKIPPGVYFLGVRTESGLVSRRVVLIE